MFVDADPCLVGVTAEAPEEAEAIEDEVEAEATGGGGGSKV